MVIGDWCGQAELVALLGVSRQRVQQIINRPDFPEPDIELIMGKVWRTVKIKKWAAERGRKLNA